MFVFARSLARAISEQTQRRTSHRRRSARGRIRSRRTRCCCCKARTRCGRKRWLFCVSRVTTKRDWRRRYCYFRLNHRAVASRHGRRQGRTCRSSSGRRRGRSHRVALTGRCRHRIKLIVKVSIQRVEQALKHLPWNVLATVAAMRVRRRGMTSSGRISMQESSVESSAA